jgi:hypothetical protein
MHVRTLLAVVVIAFTLPAIAAAQCPVQPAGPVLNPKDVCFTPSPDHDAVEGGQPKVQGYKLLVKKASDNTIVSTTDIGKPALVSGVIKLANWAGFTSLTAGIDYVLTTVAYGRGLETPDGNSVTFLKPSPPAAPGTAVVTP